MFAGGCAAADIRGAADWLMPEGLCGPKNCCSAVVPGETAMGPGAVGEGGNPITPGCIPACPGMPKTPPGVAVGELYNPCDVGDIGSIAADAGWLPDAGVPGA